MEHMILLLVALSCAEETAIHGRWRTNTDGKNEPIRVSRTRRLHTKYNETDNADWEAYPRTGEKRQERAYMWYWNKKWKWNTIWRLFCFFPLSSHSEICATECLWTFVHGCGPTQSIATNIRLCGEQERLRLFRMQVHRSTFYCTRHVLARVMQAGRSCSQARSFSFPNAYNGLFVGR